MQHLGSYLCHQLRLNLVNYIISERQQLWSKLLIPKCLKGTSSGQTDFFSVHAPIAQTS